jgi:hypothetical protein
MYEPTNPPSIPFGRHKGKPLWDVPTGYLAWLVREVRLSTGLRAAVRAALASRPDAPRGLPPDLPPRPLPACRHCGSGGPPVVYWHQQGGAGGRVIRADCHRCRRFLTFLPQTPENVAEADAAQPEAGLLDTLVRAQAEGVEIVKRGGRGGWLTLLPYGRASADLQELVRQNQHLLLRML